MTLDNILAVIALHYHLQEGFLLILPPVKKEDQQRGSAGFHVRIANLTVLPNKRAKFFLLRSLLRQEYSWGHLLVSESAFAKISSSCNVFPALRDHVASFACKISDQDEHFSVCDRKIYQTEAPSKIDQSYHGYAFSPSYIMEELTLTRNLLSPSISSETWAKACMSIFSPPDGYLPTI